VQIVIVEAPRAFTYVHEATKVCAAVLVLVLVLVFVFVFVLVFGELLLPQPTKAATVATTNAAQSTLQSITFFILGSFTVERPS
jgi:hypothetical protein